MLINKEIREELNTLFYKLKLQDKNANSSLDKQVKIEQIIGYLEIIHAELRKTSKKRQLVFVDSGAGNCYLSFLVYYFYHHIEKRNIRIHCIDYNEKLMKRSAELAKELCFQEIYFHAMDIVEFSTEEPIDMVYSLHACDTATDKTMYLGIKNKAKLILSVACCQHSIDMKAKTLKAVVRYKAFRDKMLMMISDTLRALLLEQNEYKVDIFDFVSSRFTDKNSMIRAKRTEFKKQIDAEAEYINLSSEFKMKPYLEDLLFETVF
ncbi:SAM-dependent methyltransferase [uncultured Draconibacterium sp.]|uniref:class I SAM-dependent methyltransferase n=1 Tax=uncultured Draconibacterium sp. TaxID=1573823 RepID=UPI002AA94F25|nr:SAM-dependent methyltransferase [uncultured Draconibacterium sp.]